MKKRSKFEHQLMGVAVGVGTYILVSRPAMKLIAKLIKNSNLQVKLAITTIILSVLLAQDAAEYVYEAVSEKEND